MLKLILPYKMQRKTINILLNDGKEYLFSERNSEDNSYLTLQDGLRKKNLRLIQETVEDSGGRDMLMVSEMRRIYSPDEVSMYLASNIEELIKRTFDSFKLENPGVTFEVYKTLVNETNVRSISALLNELEAGEESLQKKKVKAPRSAKK